ncbi:MAG TPA: hypothetical protein VIK70_04025 [Lysobacter sp.]
MDDKKGYAVFFFPPALDALGDAIKPYLVEGMGGAHLLCREIDTGGALIEMTLDGLDDQGTAVELEIMVPSNMVRMVVSVRGEEAFGFGPRLPLATERMAAVPDASPGDAPSESLPATADAAAKSADAPPTP